MRKQVTVRLPLNMVKRIQHLAVDWEENLGQAIERLLNEALRVQPPH